MSKTILSFLLVLAIITVSIVTFSSTESGTLERERREIVDFPKLPLKVGKSAIKEYFEAVGLFFSDHYPYRSKILDNRSALYLAIGDNVDISKCFKGKNNWLFLGNAYSRTVKTLLGTFKISKKNIDRRVKEFTEVFNFAKNCGADFFIFVGPNKSTIYPEFLPPVITPAPTRFITPFVTLLKEKGVNVYDPTEYLRKQKGHSLFYYRTDSHWNLYGAYRAFSHFTEWAGLPSLPALTIEESTPHKGDLIGMGGYTYFPLSKGDSFAIKWKNQDIFIDQESVDKKYFSSHVFTNPSSTSEKTAWIFGDSFAVALSPFINATFRNVRFYRHDDFKYKRFSHHPKPDVIIWVIVERDLLFLEHPK